MMSKMWANEGFLGAILDSILAPIHRLRYVSYRAQSLRKCA